MTESVLLPNQAPGVNVKTLGVDLAGVVHPNSLVDFDGLFPGAPIILVYDETLCNDVVRVLVERLLLAFSDPMF